MYIQCSLQNNNVIQMAWIPAKFAKPGTIIRIRENKVWSDGWKVVTTYNSMPKNWVENVGSRQYKETRKVSDI